MKKSNAFVTFMGSRGSGKTTVADELARNLSDLGSNVVRQHQGLSDGISIKGIAKAILLWRYFDLEIIKKIGFCGRAPRKIPSLYRLYLPLAFSKDLKDVQSHGDVLIYDSNFLRGMIQAFVRQEIQLQEIRSFYEEKILSKIDQVVIVVIATDPTIAVKRWLARDSVTICDEKFDKEICDRKHLQSNIDVVVDELSQCLNVTIIELQGENSPSDNVKQILHHLMK